MSVDLSKVDGAFMYEFTGKDGQKHRCVCVPVNGRAMFEGKSGVYLDLTAVVSPVGKYSTHFLKEYLGKEEYGRMTEEERRRMPIIGNMKPFSAKKSGGMAAQGGANNAVPAASAPFGSDMSGGMTAEIDDTMPF